MVYKVWKQTVECKVSKQLEDQKTLTKTTNKTIWLWTAKRPGSENNSTKLSVNILLIAEWNGI